VKYHLTHVNTVSEFFVQDISSQMYIHVIRVIQWLQEGKKRKVKNKETQQTKLLKKC